jgi:heparosan-N-sulfate-glucuronate 5-epimerase
VRFDRIEVTDTSMVDQTREVGERLRRIWRPEPEGPSILSTARSFRAPVGLHIHPGEVAGYYVDLRFKAPVARFPPEWARARGKVLYVAIAQWGLGAYERFLAGEGEEWLDAATRAGDHLVAEQQVGGARDGGWAHTRPLGHTFDLQPPWLSAMAQGEGASLLVRLHRESGDERYAETAIRAMEPMKRASSDGGVQARLDGGPFLEEYPTAPPSFVLNGGLFALWGCHDVGVGFSDRPAGELWRHGIATLTENLERFDTGYWSRYDLYPHPVINVASSAYHQLHIDQLRATSLISPDPRLEATASRFERYADSRLNFARAFRRKVLFRVVVPRSQRVPWGPARRP